jgi:hypothetical protein
MHELIKCFLNYDDDILDNRDDYCIYDHDKENKPELQFFFQRSHRQKTQPELTLNCCKSQVMANE